MRFLLSLFLVGALGCTDKSAPEPTQPATPETAAKKADEPKADEPKADEHKEGDLKTHMSDHFARALALKDAVISGDFEATREPAKWLAEHGAPDNSPDEWVPFITELRQVAAGADGAKDIAEVAAAMGRVGVVCGRCHTESKIRIEAADVAKPVGDQMLVHAWASDKMWEGLVIPDAARWAAGAEALATAASQFDEKHKKTGAEISALAKAARGAKDDLQRGVALGKIMSTCATCHAKAL